MQGCLIDCTFYQGLYTYFLNVWTCEMKPKVLKNIQNALILSICIHFILVCVLMIFYRHEPGTINEITFLEIIEVQTKRTLRAIKHKQYTTPKITPTIQKQIEVDVDPPVLSFQAAQPITHQNPVVPITGISLPNPRALGIGNSNLNTNTQILNPNIGRQAGMGKMVSPATVRVTKPQSFKPYVDKTLPQVSELKMPSAIMARIGYHIVSNRSTDLVDIVFVIDGSGSMKDNINAVRTHLSRMTKYFDDADLDFTMGVVIFREKMLGSHYEIFPQTRSVPQIKRRLAQVKCSGGEQTLDALIHAADEVDYRKNADIHFVLITDEFVSGNYNASDVLRKMRKENIKVDVVGRDEPFQKFITRSTGGLWLSISSLGAQ